MSNELATIQEPGSQLTLGAAGFDHVQRVARLFSESQLVPTTFQKNIANTTIALEMASRIGCSPLMVMQNLNIIHGKPSFGASFMIATVNACGRFTPLRFHFVGEEGKDTWGCYAVAKAKIDNFECRGVTITMEMARQEGWLSKAGSKWKTMPQLMLQYRAATFWTRAFAPEILMGFPTQDEIIDLDDAPQKNEVPVEIAPGLNPSQTTAAPTEPPATRTRKKADKGVAAMKTAEPVAEPVTKDSPASSSSEQASASQEDRAKSASPASAASTTEPSAPAVGETSKPASGPAEPEKKPAEPAPASAQEKQAEKPAEPAKAPDEEADGLLPRCEIMATTDRGAGVTELTLKGDYNGPAYHRAKAGVVIPAVGTLIDCVLQDSPSRRDPSVILKVLASFEVVG